MNRLQISNILNKYTLILSTLVITASQIRSQEIKVLDKTINTDAIEINPKISADGRVLYFTRKSVENGEEVEDIYMSTRSEDGKWQEAVKMPSPFNEGMKNSVAYVSIDGSFIIIKGYYKAGKFNPKKRGFSMVEKTKTGNWSLPEAINIENYEKMDKGMHNGFSLAPSGKVMILSLSEKKDDFLNDLYVSFKKENGTWSAPVKLPSNVNSQGNEFAPFIAADGRTLYFASDREGGLGETDIYKTVKIKDDFTVFENPVNLGAPINSPGKEGYYSLDAKGEYAYVVSSKNANGGADIATIKLREDQKASPVVLIKGKVSNGKTGEFLSASIIYQQLPDGTKLGEVKSDPSSGQFTIILPYGKRYEFFGSAKGFLSYTSFIDLSNIAEYKEIKHDIVLVPVEVGEKVRLNHIFFDYNSASLDPESFPELQVVKSQLIENPTMVIQIEGHTDNVGSAEYNRKLSEARAKSVKDYLVSKGISAQRILFIGYGESQPIADNADEDGRTANRRVEFKVVSK